MSAEHAPCRRLEFDSAFFGFEVAQATSGRLDAAHAAAVEAWCSEHRVRCLYLLADPGDPATVREAEIRGFRHVDVRVELTRPVPGAPRTRSADVRRAREDDLAWLEPIAGASFAASRFYFDDGFPRERCRALYELWLSRSLDGTLADAVLVAEDPAGEPAGFVTCAGGAGDEGRIGLFAVAPEAAGRGVGALLLQAALTWFAESGTPTVTVATQARNIDALRAYGRQGFLVARTGLWYHRWFEV